MRSAVFVVVGLLLTISLAPPGEATRPRDITAFGNLDEGAYGICPEQFAHLVFDMSPVSGNARIVINYCWFNEVQPWIFLTKCHDYSANNVWTCQASDYDEAYGTIIYWATLDIPAGRFEITKIGSPSDSYYDYTLGYAAGDVTICRASDFGFGHCPVSDL